jgi:hypothetical protein
MAHGTARAIESRRRLSNAWVTLLGGACIVTQNRHGLFYTFPHPCRYIFGGSHLGSNSTIFWFYICSLFSGTTLGTSVYNRQAARVRLTPFSPPLMRHI